MTTYDRIKNTINKLKDKDYRDAFVISHIYNGIASQIRAIREQRGWTQKELGERAKNMKQERISILENPNNSSVTINTLERIASAFDVALMIKFVPFGDLVKWDANLSSESFKVVSFGEDSYFKEEPKAESVFGSSILEACKPKSVIDIQDYKRSRPDKNSALSAISVDWGQSGYQADKMSASLQRLPVRYLHCSLRM